MIQMESKLKKAKDSLTSAEAAHKTVLESYNIFLQGYWKKMQEFCNVRDDI